MGSHTKPALRPETLETTDVGIMNKNRLLEELLSSFNVQVIEL